jgi:low affinity Fe/Cu permease
VNDNDVDNYCDTKPFNFNIEAVLEDAINNLVLARNGIEGIKLNTPEELREKIHHGESQQDPM